jgi:flagellar hook-length control protein FliK
MIQFDPALAVPAGGAAAPSGVADILSGGDASFHDFLRALDRRRDVEEDLRQREARRGTEPIPAARAADAPTATERPRENSPASDVSTADRRGAEATPESDRPPSEGGEVEAPEEAESQPAESALTANSVDAAPRRTITPADNPPAEPPVSGDAGPDASADPSQATSFSRGARRRAGSGAQPPAGVEPCGPGAAVPGAVEATSEPQIALAEPEDALASTQQEKRGAKKPGSASGTRTANSPASGQIAGLELPSAEISALGLAIGGVRGEPGSPAADEGQALEEGAAGNSPRLARSRRDHRRLASASEGASPDSSEAAADTATDGASAGSNTAGSKTAGHAVASLGGLLADPSANDLEVSVTESIAAIEPGSPAEQGRLGTLGDRVAESLGERDGASGKTASTTPLARGSAEPSAQAADRTRFVQRVVHALQAAEARGTVVRLRLSPPELGSLRLELSVRDGALLARLEVETSSARSLLLDSLPQLRERLAAQEIKIERFEVDLMNQHASDWSPGAREREHAGNAGRRGPPASGENGSAQSEVVAPAAAVHLLDAGGINVLV